MNKEQQIEEIAEILKNSATESAKYFQREIKKAFKSGAKQLKRSDCEKSIHDIAAEALYNAGYRKIDENCAVITKAELKEYKRQAVKEFAERVKNAFYAEFDEIIPSIMANKIDELLKEYEK